MILRLALPGHTPAPLAHERLRTLLLGMLFVTAALNVGLALANITRSDEVRYCEAILYAHAGRLAGDSPYLLGSNAAADDAPTAEHTWPRPVLEALRSTVILQEVVAVGAGQRFIYVPDPTRRACSGTVAP
jgi:hypothetical protein